MITDQPTASLRGRRAIVTITLAACLAQGCYQTAFAANSTLKVGQGVKGNLDYGDSSAGKAGPKRYTDSYDFEAAAGSWVVLKAVTETMSGRRTQLYLLNSAKTVLGVAPAAVVPVLVARVAQAGTYTVEIATGDDGTYGRYELTLTLLTNSGAACEPGVIEPGTAVKGEITTSDCTSAANGGGSRYVKRFRFAGQAGVTLVAEAKSGGGLLELNLISPAGNLLRTSDPLSDTRLAAVLPESGNWTVEVVAFSEGETASFQLNVWPLTAPESTRADLSGVDMDFVELAAGSFLMGCSPNDNDCAMPEKPAHPVYISKKLQMGKFEVTQAQWQAVMGTNPSIFKGEDLPVETVSWNDVQDFLGRLNARNDGYRYRLPTEAEWERAARAGTTGIAYGAWDDIAWHRYNSGLRSHPAGGKAPNAWGLYDMIGNVGEWCQDRYDQTYFSGAYSAPPTPEADPLAGGDGYRVFRGGSWKVDEAKDMRVSVRSGRDPKSRDSGLGFRCVRERVLLSETAVADLGDAKLEFATIPAGEFIMGCDTANATCAPSHTVRITREFQIGRYEVTRAQWEAVMGKPPSGYATNSPSVPVSLDWPDWQPFLQKLNARNDGYRYRMPTEAEWEYAARAGTRTDGYCAENQNAYTWNYNNAEGHLHPVGMKPANPWGLFDVLGNVAEWTGDWYDAGYYQRSPESDPAGAASGTAHPLRGGDIQARWSYLSVTFRATGGLGGIMISNGYLHQGLRVVREIPAPRPSVVMNSSSFAGEALRGLTAQDPQAIAIAPGTMMSIFGAAFAGQIAIADTVPLPTQLAGLRITAEGSGGITDLPLQYVSPSQVNALLPLGFKGKTGRTQWAGTASTVETAVLRVVANGVASEPVILVLAAVAPGLYARNGSGSGTLLALTPSFQLAEGVKSGDTIIVYGTGWGAVDTSGRCTSPIRLRIGGQLVSPMWAGLSPFAGVYQINVQIPSGLAGRGVRLVAPGEPPRYYPQILELPQ